MQEEECGSDNGIVAAAEADGDLVGTNPMASDGEDGEAQDADEHEDDGNEAFASADVEVIVDFR